MGWVILLLLIAASLGVLWALGARGGLLTVQLADTTAYRRVTTPGQAAESATQAAAGSTSQQQQVVVRGPSLAERLFGTTQGLLIGLFEVIVLLYFLLAAGDLFLQKLVRVVPEFTDKKKAVHIVREAESSVSVYLGTVTLVNLGLGAAIAKGLAEAGAHVACHGNTRSPDQTCKEIVDNGGTAQSVVGDLGVKETATSLVQETIERFGRLDIVINNAGTIRRAPAAVYSDEDWETVIEVNLSSLFRLSRTAGKHMLDRGEGGKIAGVHGIKFNDADNRYKSLFTMTSEAYGCRETRSLP